MGALFVRVHVRNTPNTYNTTKGESKKKRNVAFGSAHSKTPHPSAAGRATCDRLIQIRLHPSLVGQRTAKLTQSVIMQRHLRFRINVLQVPAEAFALESFPQVFAFGRVSSVHFERLYVDGKVEVLPFVQPHVGKACVVMVDNFARSAREGVGSAFAEHMADVGASGNLQGATTHPNLFWGKTFFINKLGSRRQKLATMATDDRLIDICKIVMTARSAFDAELEINCQNLRKSM